MAWVTVSYEGVEVISSLRPTKLFRRLLGNHKNQMIALPKGSIKKLIGRDLTWEDSSVELEGDSHGQN